jgi:hypothetical protein
MAGVKILTDIVRREVEDYVRPSLNSTAYYLENAHRQTFAVIVVPHLEPEQRFRKSAFLT